TATYDLEKEPENFKDISCISENEIYAATKQFTGNILQMPPQHSAIKKDGKRLYESARKGIEVKVDPRPVTIHEFEITKIELPVVHFKVKCSTGTYIRSLANDFGVALNCGAYLSSLCRTAIGDFTLNNAYSIENFEKEIALLRKEEASIL
ncbi:MAG: tRNA pseudouridine(55) synthase, partial [Chitinophagaceae bacterium]|nr:tRNA pseudouridine(55) synthase [Chitinophagaceae bacterium]